jgi:hypothetical protein
MITVGAIAGVISLLGTIGGGVIWLGKPPYANEDWAKDQFAQVQNQFASSRLNQVDAQIVQLENEKRRRPLSPIELDLLRRLYNERRQLVCQLRIEKC